MRYAKLTSILCITLWVGFSHSAQAELRPFVAGSLPDILAARQNQPFLLVLWSLDCPPCLKELNLLADIRREHPQLELVTISTDDVDAIHEVREILDKQGLSDVESWVFSGPDAQRLRYEIDPAWYGEIPRSYFYNGEHERLAVSGALKRDQLKAWLETVQP
ncbi:MAG: TlpA family protein disulfide reductase [Deltaproteobacteria bacterium]|nr:TlpA family protein disulfide reductase [Deltaproteobacteria bacterium]